MMILLLLLHVILQISFTVASETIQESSKYIHGNKHGRNSYVISNTFGEKHKTFQPSATNLTFYDQPDNQMRVPFFNKNYEEYKKRKHTKKSPKRTIQKIIKKNKTKNRNIYSYRLTSYPPTLASVPVDDEIYAKEALSQREDDTPTTQVIRKKKARKWKAKVARYPMPFQKMQRREPNPYSRAKRALERDNTYILQDLDEVTFLSKEDGLNAINVHIKKYW